MAVASTSLNINNAFHTPNRTQLVTVITSLIQRLNPQSHNFKNLTSNPINQFSHHLDCEVVLKVIKNQTNPYHALFFFNWASNPTPNSNNYTHSHLCYKAIIDTLLSHSLLSTASSLLQESTKLSDFFISKLIKAYGDRGNFKAAIFWFNQARKIENGKCLFSYNSVLGVLVRGSRMKLAEAFFDQMFKDNVVQPDVSTYTTMIRGFCKMGMIENAKKVFDEMMVEPNLLTFNTMINGFCKKGDMKGAGSILDRMMSSEDCLPDTVTYTTLIDGYCKSGELEEAMKFMNEMVRRGLQPNVLTYNALIYGLCLRGYVDQAKIMVTKMRLDGLKDNISTHNSILKGLCIKGKLDEAVKYLKNMSKSDIKPDVISYGAVINGYCKKRKSEDATSLLEEMQAGGIKPNVSSFNGVLRILLGNGEFDRAILLLKKMPKMGCLPNFISHSTIICSLCMAKGRMQEVEGLLDAMLRSGHNIDGTMYSLLLKGYCDSGNFEMAMRIANEMVSHKFVINLESFSVLVKELCAKMKFTEAEKLFEMCVRCPVDDKDNYRRILDEHVLFKGIQTEHRAKS